MKMKVIWQTSKTPYKFGISLGLHYLCYENIKKINII